MTRVWFILLAALATSGILTYRMSSLHVYAAAEKKIPLKGTVKPDTGRGRDQIFEVKYNAQDGKEIKEVRLLISPFRDGRNACYVYYQPSQKAFLLINDEGDSSEKLPIDGGSSIENRRCRLNAKGSSVSGSGANLTVKFSLAFTPLFDGDKHLYLYAEDKSGNLTDLQQSGDWKVQAKASFLRSTAN